MDQHPGGVILLVALKCYRNWDKLPHWWALGNSPTVTDYTLLWSFKNPTTRMWTSPEWDNVFEIVIHKCGIIHFTPIQYYWYLSGVICQLLWFSSPWPTFQPFHIPWVAICIVPLTLALFLTIPSHLSIQSSGSQGIWRKFFSISDSSIFTPVFPLKNGQNQLLVFQ